MLALKFTTITINSSWTFFYETGERFIFTKVKFLKDSDVVNDALSFFHPLVQKYNIISLLIILILVSFAHSFIHPKFLFCIRFVL